MGNLAVGRGENGVSRDTGHSRHFNMLSKLRRRKRLARPRGRRFWGVGYDDRPVRTEGTA